MEDTPINLPAPELPKLNPTIEEIKVYEKLHYDKHIEFIKWIVGFAGTAITLIVGVALWSSYSNMKDYKDDLKENIGEIKSDIKDIKLESINTIRETKAEVDQQTDRLKNEINNQIPIIKENASDLALIAVRKSIREEFEESNIRNLIQKTADESLNRQVGNILDIKIKSASKDIDEQVKALATLSVAIDQIRNGDRRWFMIIDSIKNNHNIPVIRELASTLQKQKTADYEKAYLLMQRDSTLVFYSPGDISYKKGYDSLMLYIAKTINTSNSLDNIALAFLALNKVTNQKFEMFDFDGYNLWLKKTYPKERQRIKQFYEKQNFKIE